jgi:hypothetical protein
MNTHLHLVARSRMMELYLHSPCVFMALCVRESLINHRDNFTFIFYVRMSPRMSLSLEFFDQNVVCICHLTHASYIPRPSALVESSFVTSSDVFVYVRVQYDISCPEVYTRNIQNKYTVSLAVNIQESNYTALS